jgi:hypothetical protein
MQHLPRRFAGSVGLLFGLAAIAGLTGCNALTGVSDLEVSGGVGGAGHGGANGAGGAGQVGGGSTNPGVGGVNPSAGPGASTTGVGSGAVTSTGATTVTSTSVGASTTTAASTGSGGNPTAEQVCVDTINHFRATRGLPAYTRWTSNEACVDGEAQTDSGQMTAHYAFEHGQSCGSNAQNECPGWSTDPLNGNGIAACLQQMWNEKDQAGCAGCDTCDFPYQNCTNCDFDGTTVCGHYLNMKSGVLSTVACGFYDTTGWYAQDFK